MEISKKAFCGIKKGEFEASDLNGCVLSVVSIKKWSATKGHVIELSDDCEVFEAVFAEALNDWVKWNLKVNDVVQIKDGIVGAIQTRNIIGPRKKLIVFVIKVDKVK
jgi:hypothetical protein